MRNTALFFPMQIVPYLEYDRKAHSVFGPSYNCRKTTAYHGPPWTHSACLTLLL